MNKLKWVLAGLVTGLILAALRTRRRDAAGVPDGSAGLVDPEPVLGYDGMDQETLLEWLASADLDPEAIRRTIRYEEAHLAREPILDALFGRTF